MKKLLVFTAISAMSFGAFAQGKHNGNKNHGKGHDKEMKKGHDDGNNENDNDHHDNDGNGNMKKQKKNGEYNHNNNDHHGKMTTHAPHKVMDAFQRDYPNSGGATWTKNKGVWTATFNNGGIFGGARSVSYKANGQRVTTTTTPFR